MRSFSRLYRPLWFCIAVLAAFVVVLPVAARGPANLPEEQQRSISVSGEGFVDYVPEFVTMVFSVTARAPGHRDAQQQMMKVSNRIIDAMSSLAWIDTKDLSTQSFSLNEDWQYVNNKRESVGFVATTRLSLRVRSIDRYAETLLALLDAGVNGIESVSFGVADEAALRIRALENAIANARSKAERMAGAAGSSVGKVISIQESSASAPYIANRALAAAAPAYDGGSGSILAEGLRKISAQVSVVFALK